MLCSQQEGSENEEEEREEEDEENTDYLTDSNKENETDEENNVRFNIWRHNPLFWPCCNKPLSVLTSSSNFPFIYIFLICV